MEGECTGHTKKDRTKEHGSTGQAQMQCMPRHFVGSEEAGGPMQGARASLALKL